MGATSALWGYILNLTWCTVQLIRQVLHTVTRSPSPGPLGLAGRSRPWQPFMYLAHWRMDYDRPTNALDPVSRCDALGRVWQARPHENSRCERKARRGCQQYRLSGFYPQHAACAVGLAAWKVADRRQDDGKHNADAAEGPCGTLPARHPQMCLTEQAQQRSIASHRSLHPVSPATQVFRSSPQISAESRAPASAGSRHSKEVCRRSQQGRSRGQDCLCTSLTAADAFTSTEIC